MAGGEEGGNADGGPICRPAETRPMRGAAVNDEAPLAVCCQPMCHVAVYPVCIWGDPEDLISLK